MKFDVGRPIGLQVEYFARLTIIAVYFYGCVMFRYPITLYILGITLMYIPI